MTRALLYFLFGLTLLGGLGVLDSLLDLGRHITPTLTVAALYAMAPGIAAAVLARKLWTGGKAVWWALVALQAWLLVGSVVNLYTGSARGITQLLLPAVLLALVSEGASRAWFELPPDRRAVKPRWTLRRWRRERIPSVPHLIRWRRNRGQSTVEYVGMVGIVGLIIGALLFSGVGPQISGGLQTAVCNILGGDCESDTVAGGDGEPGDHDSGGGDSGGGSDSGGGDSGGGSDGGGDSGGTGGDSGGGGSDGGGSDSGGGDSDGDDNGGGGNSGGGSDSGGGDSGGGDSGGDSGGGDSGGGDSGGGSTGGDSEEKLSGGGYSVSGGDSGGDSSGGSGGGSDSGGDSGGTGGDSGGGDSGGGSDGGGDSGGTGGDSGGGGSDGGGSDSGGGDSDGDDNGGGGNSGGGSDSGGDSGGGSDGGAGSGGSDSGGDSGGGSDGGGDSGGSSGGVSVGGSDSGGDSGGSRGFGSGGSARGTTGGDSDGEEEECNDIWGFDIVLECEEEEESLPPLGGHDPPEPDLRKDKECPANTNAAFYGDGRYALASAGVRTRAVASGAVLAAGSGAPSPMGLVRTVSGSSLAGVGTFQGVDDRLNVKIGLTDPPPAPIPDSDPPADSDPPPDSDPPADPDPGPGKCKKTGTDPEDDACPVAANTGRSTKLGGIYRVHDVDAGFGNALTAVEADECNGSNPGVNPHPEVQVDDIDVDLSKLPDETVWRDSDEPLYRFDNRPPDEVFLNDFAPKDPDNTDLWDYTRSNNDSAFVSTTTNDKADMFYETKYRYDIDPPGGIDINATFGDNSRYDYENEIAFPGGIDSQYIKGAWELDENGDPTGTFIENPYYVPPDERE